VPALRVPVWRIGKDERSARERTDADEVDWLLWNDRVLGGNGFVPWHEVAHPQLGTVEVGGWKRFTRYEPPADLLPDAVRRVMRVPAVHAAFAPQLAVRIEVTPRGAGLASVKVRVDNVGGAPTETVRAERAARATPVRLVFVPAKDVDVVAGPPSAALGTLPAGGASVETEWLVRRAGPGPLGTATASHRVAGTASAEGTLP